METENKMGKVTIQHMQLITFFFGKDQPKKKILPKKTNKKKTPTVFLYNTDLQRCVKVETCFTPHSQTRSRTSERRLLLSFVCFVSFERDLQYAVSEAIAVQAGDGHSRLVVVGHGDEAEAFALVRVEVTDHLHVRHGTKRPEHLPQDALIRIRSQIVDKDAPACAGMTGDVDAQTGDTVDGHGRKPTEEEIRVRVSTHIHLSFCDFIRKHKHINNTGDKERCS